MNSEVTPELSVMAAELALGVLEGEERAVALRQSLSDPAFAAQVREWQDRLNPLGEGFAEVQPPNNLWPAIAARLDAPSPFAEIGRVRFWRNTAALAGTVAASLAAVMTFNADPFRQARPSTAPTVIAQLAGTEGTLLAAVHDPQTDRLIIRAVALPDSDLVPELWVIPGDGVPRSLGLIAPDGTTQITLPLALQPLVVDGAVLAVSLETAQGAPHKAPSSTPIATGKISAI